MQIFIYLGEIFRNGEYRIYVNLANFVWRCWLVGYEIRELNRIICRQCNEKDYEKCKNCKVYLLVNKLAAQ